MNVYYKNLFLEFPLGCSQYEGPHRIECYITIWNDVGCNSYGWSFPNNLTRKELASYKNLNIRFVIGYD